MMNRAKSEAKLDNRKRRQPSVRKIKVISRKKKASDIFDQDPLNLMPELKLPDLKPSIQTSRQVNYKKPKMHVRMISINRETPGPKTYLATP